MGGTSSSGPSYAQYNPVDIINADAQANRTDTNTPFGSSSWTNNGGKWTQNVSLSPELQQVFQGALGMAGQSPAQFSSQGLAGTPFQRPTEDMGNHMVGRKQQAQNMNYAPPQGQGLSSQGQFSGYGGMSSPDNAQSARDAAALFGEFVPKPDAYDPMKFAGVYDQLFGGRLYKG